MTHSKIKQLIGRIILLGLLDQTLVDIHGLESLLGRLDEDAAGGTLGAGGGTQILLAGHEQIRDAVLLQHDGKMTDDVNGEDIASDDGQSLVPLTNSLDQFLDAPTDVLGRAGLPNQLVDAFGGLLGCQRGGDGVDRLDAILVRLLALSGVVPTLGSAGLLLLGLLVVGHFDTTYLLIMRRKASPRKLN